MENNRNVLQIRKEQFDAVIFDMDGVVTQTAKTHAAAWKKLFDGYLAGLEQRKGIPFKPFSIEEDYLLYVDGKPRYEGIKCFLESRGLDIPPWGDQGDPSDRETLYGLGNRKNLLFLEIIRNEGVEVYDSTIALIHRLKSLKLKTAVVTSSKNCEEVLREGNIRHLFDAKVDGKDAERMKLAGKPDPALFLYAARSIGVDPDRTVVIEDAIAGVQAAKRGRFGCVIGVDRAGQADALRNNGADITVKDLSEISAG